MCNKYIYYYLPSVNKHEIIDCKALTCNTLCSLHRDDRGATSASLVWCLPEVGGPVTHHTKVSTGK